MIWSAKLTNSLDSAPGFLWTKLKVVWVAGTALISGENEFRGLKDGWFNSQSLVNLKFNLFTYSCLSKTEEKTQPVGLISISLRCEALFMSRFM